MTTPIPLSRYPTMIQSYSTLLCDDERTRLMNDIKFGLQSRIAATVPQELAYRINDLLWHSDINPSLGHFIEEKIKMALVEVFSKRSSQAQNSISGSAKPLEELKNSLPRIFIDLMAQAGVVYDPRFNIQERLNQPEQISTVPKIIKQKSIDQPQFSRPSKYVAPEMDFNASKMALREVAMERIAATRDTLVHWSSLVRGAMEWRLYLWGLFLTRHAPVHNH
ncbi:unnamed protein product [Rhizoctonia solani]|uniref:Uncharacterized protein n=1 Tax=Rhizoctonia solani TaxID=456999 RepID=A0A8H3ATE3_9AGAM|nr:unnamed protein product [Rhizoctonia solani]